MTVERFVDNPAVHPSDIALIPALRLDPSRWEIKGVSPDQGVIDTSSDDEPDSRFVVSTDSLRGLDRGFMTIHVTMKHGLGHVRQACGRVMRVHDRVSASYDSSPVMSMAASVRIHVPRPECPRCGGCSKAGCPLVVPDHTYTGLLKLDVLACLSEETVESTSEACRIGPWIVGDIPGQATREGSDGQDPSNVETLCIDGIRSTHGQNHITMVADQDHRAIAGVSGHDVASNT